LINFKDICECKYDFKQNEKSLTAHINELHGPRPPIWSAAHRLRNTDLDNVWYQSDHINQISMYWKIIIQNDFNERFQRIYFSKLIFYHFLKTLFFCFQVIFFNIQYRSLRINGSTFLQCFSICVQIFLLSLTKNCFCLKWTFKMYQLSNNRLMEGTSNQFSET